MKNHIAVIGAGVAGTSAANWLVGHGYGVTILERNPYIGGRVHSRYMQGTAAEMGAGFVTDAYPNLRAFLRESGLENQLSPQRSTLGILNNGLVSVPSVRTLVSNDLLSFRAKMYVIPLLQRMLAGWRDLDFDHIWRAYRYDNRSVEEMFSGKNGKEFIECALQPILNGYFYWTPEHTSEAVMLAICKAAFSHSTYRMKTGLQRIPERLAQGSTVLLSHTVKHIATAKNGYDITVEYRDRVSSLLVDGVVCATTASMVPVILSDLSKEQAQFFNAIKYSSTALVTQAYKTNQETSGSKSIAFPRREGVDLSSLTLSFGVDAKGLPLTTTRMYASGAMAKEINTLSDKRLVERLTKSAGSIPSEMGLGKQAPVDVQIQRWPEALPFFDVGHLKHLRAFEQGGIESPDKPIVFAGDYIGGPYMEGAFTSGMRAAERLSSRLQ